MPEAQLLNRLADLLEENASNEKGMRFDLDKVGLLVGLRLPKFTPEGLLTCDTVGCAMGLAAMSGRFPGLDYILIHRRIAIRYKESYHFLGIACELFGLDYKTAYWLFVPNETYREITGAEAEREVARRLRFIANGGEGAEYRNNYAGV